jgi:hypothetical protein
MDLIKQAIENRRNAGVAQHAPTPSLQEMPKPADVMNRASIIEMKPKNKVVKAYFESIVAKVVDSADNEDD